MINKACTVSIDVAQQTIWSLFHLFRSVTEAVQAALKGDA